MTSTDIVVCAAALSKYKNHSHYYIGSNSHDKATITGRGRLAASAAARVACLLAEGVCRHLKSANAANDRDQRHSPEHRRARRRAGGSPVPRLSRSPGIPGATRSQHLQRRAFMSWRPTCAATARATRQRRSISTRCSIWSATWSVSSMRSRPGPPSSSAMIFGARVAWQAAQMRPDRFRGVVGLSVPFYTARQGASDQRHAADGERAVLSALFSGAGSRRCRAGARSAFDHTQHAVRRIRRGRCCGPRGRGKRRGSAEPWHGAEGRRLPAGSGRAGGPAGLDHRERYRFLRGRIQAHRLHRCCSTGIATSTAIGNCRAPCRARR